MDGSAGSVQNPVQPQQTLNGFPAKWLKVKQFLRAEVVKLADTPSASTRASDRSYLAEK
jgi:hypothetical protein